MSHPSYVHYINETEEKIHACVAPFINDQPISMVGFPDIRNVGDSAIWLGEIAYLLNRHQKAPDYVSTMWDFSESRLEKIAPVGPIFVQGGGTFGDIWASHQDFRIRLLKSFPKRTIVQMPQSIHYNSQERVDEMAKAISAHKNFTLLLRDEESVDFARKNFDCQVKLCPDAAFGIGALKRQKPIMPLLAMLRDDREKKSDYDFSAFPDLPVEDWIFTEKHRLVRMAKILGMVKELPTVDSMKIRAGKFNAAANQRFKRGVNQLERSSVIVTDRLHVHIVSLLLGIPHAVLDNSYGKITRFMSAFPGGMDITYRANSLTDAVEWARERLNDEKSTISA